MAGKSNAIQRRLFLKSLAAFAAAGGASLTAKARPRKGIGPDWPRALVDALDDEVAEPLGEYWHPYLDRIAAKVNSIAKRTADGFWFLTDLHIPSNHMQSGKAIAALAKRTAIGKTLCGGDFPEAFAVRKTCRFETDRAGVDFAARLYRALWVDAVESAGVKVYTAKGNHDFTIRHDDGVNAGFTYSGAEARKVIMSSRGCADVVTNSDDPEACYYYFDNDKANVRYIVADTTDTVNPRKPFWAVEYGMHDTQLVWLAEQAFATIPSGWSVVVMHHIPITTVVGYESEERLFAPFRTLLEAYQNRGSWTLAGRTFDFASAGGRIILDITGHHHAERQTFRNGILHVTEPCDAAYWDEGTGAAPWCAIPPKRAEGTVFEQTFDAVQLDTKRGIVFFTRVGGGEDRAIHVTPAKVKVGERMAFRAPLLKGPVTWGCYDADRIKKTPHRRNKYLSHFKYFNDVATISDDGTLLATKAGESMVMARDANFNKEIWPVTVVA